MHCDALMTLLCSAHTGSANVTMVMAMTNDQVMTILVADHGVHGDH